MTETKKKAEIKKPLIYEKISAIMNDIQAIGKDRKNIAQKYSFRGVDDVYNEAHSAFAKHKVFTVPTVLNSHHEERKSKSGGVLIYRILTVKYTFYAIDGSSIEAVVVGEGMDPGDKATNKAMSVAHKYALLQVLLIPTDDPKDPENESPEVGDKPKSQESKPPKTDTAAIRQGIPPATNRSIPLVLTDGTEKLVTKFEALKSFGKIKEAIGEGNYYHILEDAGYKKSNLIPESSIPAMYALMVKYYNEVTSEIPF